MMKTQLDLLIEVYREAQIKLIQIVSDKNTGAGTKTYYNTVLKRLEELMKELEAKTGKYIEKSVPREYKKALDETYAYFQKNHLQMKQPDMFAQIHSDAVHELAREMQYHINLGISQAGRRVIRYLDTSRDNILRLQSLRSSAVKISSGQTVLDMQKDLLQRLSNDGFLTVQYGSGTKAYQVGLDTYTAMVARSTTREAGNLARENQLTDNGYDLMIMTEHYPTCKTCAMLQGRVYSISGEDKRFPPLSKAFASGYRNVHPNCRHVVVPFVEELHSDEELQQAIKRSNEPFEDNRSDDEKALYSKQQADNRRMRSDRSQYERYKARLGDEAPKTFSAFRRIKKADGQNWKDLQKLYRSKFQKTVDNSGESGIIKLKDSGDIIFPNIVDKAPKLTYFEDNNLNTQIENTANSILEMAKNYKIGTEFAYVINAEPPYTIGQHIIGEEGSMSVKIPRCSDISITLHNHPSGETFSARDIDRFVIDEKAKAMCVIGNNGNWYILEKTDLFDWFTYQIGVLEISKKDNFAQIILEGAEKYGFKYYKKTY